MLYRNSLFPGKQIEAVSDDEAFVTSAKAPGQKKKPHERIIVLEQEKRIINSEPERIVEVILSCPLILQMKELRH